LTAEEAAELAGIGGAAGRNELNQPLPFAQYAFLVKGLSDAPTERGSETRLALYETTRSPLRDQKRGQEYNFYLFRVVEVVPSVVPESLEEVRDLVEQDLREYKGFLRAAEEAQRLKQASGEAETGLEEAVNADKEFKELLGLTAVMKIGPFSRIQPINQRMLQFGQTQIRPSYIYRIGRDEKFIAEAFEMAEDAEERGERLVRVISLPADKKHAVIESLELQRVTDSDYETHRQDIEFLLRTNALRAFRDDWFDPERIRERADFSLVEPKK
jgi:hypothetical protein